MIEVRLSMERTDEYCVVLGEGLEWCIHFRLLNGRVSNREFSNRCHNYLERVDVPLVDLLEKVADGPLCWVER